MTLLETALATADKRKSTERVKDEEIELAVAYIEGRVTPTQAATALGLKKAAEISSRLLPILRRGYEAGALTIRRKNIDDPSQG